VKADAAPAPPPTPYPTVESQDADATTGDRDVAAASAAPALPPAAPNPSTPTTKDKRKGHGRVPASAYRAARHIAVEHETLRRGDSCPACRQGRVYLLVDPAPIVRVVGQAPLKATCWDCAKFRCGACGQVFTARPPPEAQGEKYDETASSLIALLHCGTGVPFHRLERLQANLDTPVPASTPWDVIRERVERVEPVYNELKRLSAQAEILHTDDSPMRAQSRSSFGRPKVRRSSSVAWSLARAGHRS